jgi:iron complex transport system permease protein
MPRLLLALMVGLALGTAGAIAQAVMRNPLAEPGLLGINSGAGLAAMVLMVGMERTPDYLLPPAAFAGATAMAAAIYTLSWRHGTSSLRIILIGIGLAALGNAATSFLTAFGDVRLVQRAMIWLAGSVADASWSKVEAMFAWSLLPLIAVWMTARELDTISFGDDSARSLGQRVNLVRGLMILMCTALSGAAVAFAGLVGFVGLIAPHMARRLVGNGHGRVIPAAALLGAVLVMTADFIGRTIIAPAQLPAGLLTALLGAPFFAWLMWERRHVPA